MSAPIKDLAVHVEDLGRAASTVHLDGYIDAYTTEMLDECLGRLVDDGTRTILVDCREITHLSTHGVATLMKHHLALRDLGGEVRLVGLPEKIRWIFVDLDLDEYFPVYGTPEDALAKVLREMRAGDPS
jgi:anti-sigma B factor antagonist